MSIAIGIGLGLPFTNYTASGSLQQPSTGHLRGAQASPKGVAQQMHGVGVALPGGPRRAITSQLSPRSARPCA